MASGDPSPMPLIDDWITEVGADEVDKIIRAGLAEVENVHGTRPHRRGRLRDAGGGPAPALGFVNWRISGISSFEPDYHQAQR